MQGNKIKKIFLCSLGFCQFTLTQKRFMKSTVTISQAQKISEQILLGKGNTLVLLPYLIQLLYIVIKVPIIYLLIG